MGAETVLGEARRQENRTINQANDFEGSDLGRWPCEAVAAVGAVFRSQETGF